MRQLALELRVNPNTVSQAYRDLEREGLTFVQRGQGTFVADLPEGRRAEERARVARELVESMLAEALRLGLAPVEVREAVEASLGVAGAARG